jgi:hypothetical protein
MLVDWSTPGLLARFRELLDNPEVSFTDTAAVLCAEFNMPFTRNACIGKANRLGLRYSDEKRKVMAARGATNSTKTRLAKSGPPKPKRTGRPDGRAMLMQRRKTFTELFGVLTDDLRELPHDTSDNPKNILELLNDRSQCRWPVTTPDGELQLFCADAVVPNRPYCTRHCYAAYGAGGRDRPDIRLLRRRACPTVAVLANIAEAEEAA